MEKTGGKRKMNHTKKNSHLWDSNGSQELENQAPHHCITSTFVLKCDISSYMQYLAAAGNRTPENFGK
jgi:hypothetical protein